MTLLDLALITVIVLPLGWVMGWLITAACKRLGI